MARTRGSSKSGVVSTSGSVTGSTTRARWADLARRHLGHQLVRARLDHGQVDAGVAGVEHDEQAGADALVMRLGVAPTARRPRADPESTRASGPVASTSADDPLVEGEEGGAVGREGDGALARAPVEEHHAQLLLQQADLARQRRLGQVQAGGGAGEAPLLGHRQGVGQLVQLHIQSLSL